MRDAIRADRDRYASIFVAYGDCGTGGLLDAVLRRGRRRAHSRRALLRILRRQPRVRSDGRRRARHVLPHRFPAPAFRPPRDPRPRPRPPSGARARSISAITGASSIWRRSKRRSASPRRARRPSGWDSRSRIASPGTADWSEAFAPPSTGCRHGKADRHLLARRAVAGRREAGPRHGPRAAVRTIPGGRRPCRDARGQGQVGCLHRRLEARRAARLRQRPQGGGDRGNRPARGAVQRRRPRAADPRQRARGAGGRAHPAVAATPGPSRRSPDARRAPLVGAARARTRNLLSALRARHGGARSAVAARRLRARRAAGGGRRARRQGLPVRLPDVRAMRAELDRHVLSDELPEGAAQRTLRRRARRRPLRSGSADAMRLGRRDRRQRPDARGQRSRARRAVRGRPAGSPAARRGSRWRGKSRRAARGGRRHDLRRRAGPRLSAADPAGPHVARPPRARAARRRLRGDDRARSAGLRRSGGRLPPRPRVRRLRRRDQRDRRQRRQLPHVEPRRLRAPDARRLRARDADLVPRQEPHRDPGRHPGRRRDGRVQHAVPHRRRRGQRRSSAGEARVRPRLHDAARDRHARCATSTASRADARSRSRRACSSARRRIRSRRLSSGARPGSRRRSPRARSSSRRNTATTCPRLKAFMERAGDLGLPERAFILVGVGPLRSAKAAEWMRTHVPGVHIPDDDHPAHGRRRRPGEGRPPRLHRPHPRDPRRSRVWPAST